MVVRLWKLDIEGPNGGPNIANDVSFRSARITWTSDGPGAIEVELRATELDIDDYWVPGLHRVIARYHDAPIFAGYIHNLRRSGAPAEYNYTVSGVGLASILDYRIVRHMFNTEAQVTNICWNLIDEAQDQINGDMGFSRGITQGTTITRERGYCFGSIVGDEIRELAAIARGFDWEIDATGQFNVWNTTRGVDTGVTLAESDVHDWQVESDTSDLLTTVSGLMAQDDPFGPRHDAVAAGYADNYGRREAVIDTDTEHRPELIDAVTGELSQRGGARLRVTTQWVDARSPFPFGEVWLQDKVHMQLPSFFGGNQIMRCIEITATIEPGRYAFFEHIFEALVEDITVEGEV